ncbi:MAG: hypothetical protein KGO93_10360 [Cyanobacteria bacterium REEB446]|nr:hypothetical protein [Cyanobacteria bacterium REEB446]
MTAVYHWYMRIMRTTKTQKLEFGNSTLKPFLVFEENHETQANQSHNRQGCLILKYFKNPYRRKSGQICKVMSQ